MRSSSAAPAPTAPDTDVRPDLRPSTGDGDHDRFAHYVDKNESTRAYIEGTPIRALCGKVWVPTRDPSRYPVCPTCQELMETLFGGGSRGGDGDGGEG